MATTLDEIRRLCKAMDLRTFTADDGDAMFVTFDSPRGVVHVMMALSDDGELLILRSSDLPPTTGSRRRRFRMMQALLAVNAELSALKLAVEPSDGSTTASIEVCIADMSPTEEFLAWNIQCLVGGVLEARDRLSKTLHLMHATESSNARRQGIRSASGQERPEGPPDAVRPS